MTNEVSQRFSDAVIKIELGSGTGDEIIQTAEGRWWVKWDGVDRTGQEVRELTK